MESGVLASGVLESGVLESGLACFLFSVFCVAFLFGVLALAFSFVLLSGLFCFLRSGVLAFWCLAFGVWRFCFHRRLGLLFFVLVQRSRSPSRGVGCQ